VKTFCSPDLPRVYGDFNQLQQCLINIVFNSAAAIASVFEREPPGGYVTVDVRQRGDKGQVLIRVRDDGRGISPLDLPYIFEPFFTTKEEGYGVGLGLSTAYGIIEGHRGVIEVESSPGKGSCFTITLPSHHNPREENHG